MWCGGTKPEIEGPVPSAAHCYQLGINWDINISILRQLASGSGELGVTEEPPVLIQFYKTDCSNLTDKISGHWDSVLLAEIVITALTAPYS